MASPWTYTVQIKTKMTKLKKSCGFFFLTFAYKIKNSFIANKKLTTPIKHHNVTQRSVFCFFDFSDYDVTVVQYVSAAIQPLIVSLIRHSRIIIIAIIFRHRHRRPSRSFSHHLSHYKGSSCRFMLIQLSFGFPLDLPNRKPHFNQFSLPISTRYSGPSSSMAGNP